MISQACALEPSTQELEFLWLELTEQCNLRCVHCYANSAPDRPRIGSMRLADWLNVIDEASAVGCAQLQFVGGEPTVHPDLAALIQHARDRGFGLVEIYTNGVHFQPALKEAFVRQKVSLAFSAYSHVPSVHDSITRSSGSFFKTMASIRWAVDAGLETRVGIIEMAENEGHTEATRALLAQMGVRNIRVDRMRGIGRGVRACVENPFDELCGQCWRGKLCVTPSGEALPCVFSRFWPVGHVDQGLATTLQGSSLRDFRERMRRRSRDTAPVRLHRTACSPDFDPPPGCDPSRTCNPTVSPPCSPDREARL